MGERTVPGTYVALTIAGSDSCGGAGIQADLKTFSVMNVYGASVITAITAQNTTGVKAVQVLNPELVDQQIEAVAGDFSLQATKTGMLGNRAIIEVVAAAIKRQTLMPLVVDPVMAAKSGDSLADKDAVDALCKRLLPLAAVVTPNLLEAARLLGRQESIRDLAGAKNAAREICRRFGARACVVKGLHRRDDHEGQAVDIFDDGTTGHELVAEWRPTENTHGAGCVFSAALAAALARGEAMDKAVRTAKALITEAIRQGTNLGQGRSPVNPLAYLTVK